MTINKIKLAVSEVEPGMYISLLDRSWMETPFPLQGFIATREDIRILARLCQYVYIDPEQSLEKYLSRFSNAL